MRLVVKHEAETACRQEESLLRFVQTADEGRFTVRYYLTRGCADGRPVSGVRIEKEQNGEIETASASDIFATEEQTSAFLRRLAEGVVTPMTLLTIVDDCLGE